MVQVYRTNKTMAAAESVKVYVVFERTPNVICCPNETTAEDLCIILCKKYNISPLTRTLFALRVRGTKFFLKDNFKVLQGSRNYELRIRFKVPKFIHLITLDETTFDYYFQQARNDVNINKIPEIKYPEYKKELLGLGITDMIRAVLEEKLPLKEVIKNYKKYIPEIIVMHHGSHPKKHAKRDLPNLCSYQHKANYVKTQYLQQLYALAPNYLAEEYDDVIWENGENNVPVQLMVSPFHPQEAGIRLFNTVDRKWSLVCSIEELIYLTRNSALTLEVSRRGTPVFFKFKSEEQLSSFISVCDGYYRLMVKWTFNLSKDDETPSLKELHRIKCHGPVGGAFSHRKLEEKRSKRHGSFILRQCQERYNVFYLDVCSATCTAEFYKIEFKGKCYEFLQVEYDSIEKLIRSHQNPDGRIYLKECIPPSEYDKSQLLLCAQPKTNGVRIDQAELQEILKDNKSPRCLPNKDILLIQGPWCFTTDESLPKDLCNVRDCDKDESRVVLTMTNLGEDNSFTYILPQWRSHGSQKVGSAGLTETYKAHWKVDETKKLLVAFKTLKKDMTNDYLKEFIELGSKWSCVQSTAIVRLYGITLSSPTAMVLEYMPSGRFDVYLRERGREVTSLQLKKVAAGLARALWDLSEGGVVHGFIRCERLLLSVQDGDRLVVKLSGPSLRQYTPQDVHWMPVAFFRDMNQARKSVLGDIWAFATTLWELFSYGQSPAHLNPVLTEMSYEAGDRLLRPTDCPAEVWTLIRECWSTNPLRPQEIMRDMNHMLHSEYIPTDNPYQDLMDTTDIVTGEILISSERCADAGSNNSLISDSSVPSTNGTVTDYYDNSFSDNQSSRSLENMVVMPHGLDRDALQSSQSSLVGAPKGVDETYPDSTSPRLMVSIISEGVTYLVTPVRRIGSGNYGSVYKGWMELDNQESRKKEVAIKILNADAESKVTHREDFENELAIMKSLSHVNIVEILGYSWDGGGSLLVLEYLEEGSLYYYLKFQGHNLRNSHLIKYAKDIASGMDHISAKNIFHRDLATRNILVVNKHHVKISDFGLARIVPKDANEYVLRSNRLLPIKWYAPESAVKPYKFTTQSDVWSYGVTAWEIFTRAQLEVPDFDLERPRERASVFPIPEGCPSEIYRHLMKNCWDLDPSGRPKFIDLVHDCKRFAEAFKDGN